MLAAPPGGGCARRAARRLVAEAEQSDGHALEGEVDVHAFAPADLRRLLRDAGFEDARVGGEELLANAWGWGLRTVESSAEPETSPCGGAASPSAATSPCRRSTPAARAAPAAELFYNLLVSARKPAA